MKTFGRLLLFISWFWLVAVYAQPFESFFRRVFSRWPVGLRWFFQLPDPPPAFGRITCENSWPVALGFVGTLLAFAIIYRAEHETKKGGDDEI